MLSDQDWKEWITAKQMTLANLRIPNPDMVSALSASELLSGLDHLFEEVCRVESQIEPLFNALKRLIDRLEHLHVDSHRDHRAGHRIEIMRAFPYREWPESARLQLGFFDSERTGVVNIFVAQDVVEERLISVQQLIRTIQERSGRMITISGYLKTGIQLAH